MSGSSILTAPNLIVALITALVAAVAIVIHYEVLNWLFRRMGLARAGHRPRALLLVLVVTLAHIVEIWWFGIAYWLLLKTPALGSISGVVIPDLFDCIYFSATTYTTAGYGDVVLNGAVRILAGTEGLVGLMMITWSASFTIVQMHRAWKPE